MALRALALTAALVVRRVRRTSAAHRAAQPARTPTPPLPPHSPALPPSLQATAAQLGDFDAPPVVPRGKGGRAAAAAPVDGAALLAEVQGLRRDGLATLTDKSFDRLARSAGRPYHLFVVFNARDPMYQCQQCA